MKTCKYYDKHLETIREYISCLYALEDCCCGGLLHSMIDDGNTDDETVKRTLAQCETHPECEESELGKLICREFLKLPREQRRLVYEPDWAIDAYCNGPDACDQCPIHNETLSWWG